MQTLSNKPEFEQDLVEKKTRLGQISFINTLPISLPLQKGAIALNCTQVYETPAKLNDMLQSGDLWLGAMSSFFFLQDGRFELFKNISISGGGKVGSVLLFSKRALKDLNSASILVPDSSATSIKLLQLLLKDEHNVEPVLRKQDGRFENESDCFLAGKDFDALLLIGDRALKQDEQLSKQPGVRRVDLAQWWFKRFSLPFVFGVWGARKDWAENNRKEFEQISSALYSACQLGLGEMFEQVLNEASVLSGLQTKRLSCYYRNELDYRLKEEHDQALALFGSLCKKHGLL